MLVALLLAALIFVWLGRNVANNARRWRCNWATTFGKFADLQLPPLRDHILAERARWAAWLFSIGGDGIMNPRRFATVAPAFCGTVVLAGWIVASLAGFGSAGIEITAAVPIEDRPATSLPAAAELAGAPQATAMGNAAAANAAVANAEVATAAEPVTGTATDTTAASDKPESIVVAALPDSSQMLPPETPPMSVTTASTPDA